MSNKPKEALLHDTFTLFQSASCRPCGVTNLVLKEHAPSGHVALFACKTLQLMRLAATHQLLFLVDVVFIQCFNAQTIL